MATPAMKHVELAAEEWNLLGDLLKREIRNLPLEIRHTDVRAAREALHTYMRRAEALLEKLRPVLED